MTTPSKLTPEQLIRLRAKVAREESERFVRKLDDFLAEIRDIEFYASSQSKQRAAAKRASLDLTRALAQFRRSPYE